MLLSLALICLFGICIGGIFEKLHLPKSLGLIITGIILGPYVLNLIDGSVLGISSELRKIALIIILLRAGLNLNINDLKKVGRPALLLCFLPACFEIFGIVLLAPVFLGLNLIDSLILGTVIAAVSPAVVVPRMLKLMDEKYGTDKHIPQMIMAGSTVDDVFVIVLFTVFTNMAAQNTFTAATFARIPTSIVFGILAGIIVGLILYKFFTLIHMRDSVKVIIMLSVAFLLAWAEELFTGAIGFSGLVAVMTMGIVIKRNREQAAARLSEKFSKLWVCAELFLFVLVGATVDLEYVTKYGAATILLILSVLLFRSAGVVISTLGTNLNKKERLFSVFSYMPKATVQAAIGSMPLAMGLSCGHIVLTCAVLCILITAPLGTFLIDSTYKKLLKKQ